jgi:hypothetical protein
MIEQRADHYAEVFFNHLVRICRRPELFARRGVLDRAKQRKARPFTQEDSSSTPAREGSASG